MVRCGLIVALVAAFLPQTAAATTPLAPCTIDGTAARCGALTVPENRSVPGGRTIDVAVAVLPASGRPRRPDPVFYIAGGPGGAARRELPAIATSWAGVNGHRDIVFVDQRGVGGSNPLRCTEATAGFHSVADFVHACLFATPADVLQYRTPVAMDDLDAVRRWLGYGQIAVWGGSYGATAAQVYLRRHADAVRTVVLDGATLLDIPVFERWARSAHRALVLLDKLCKADRACAQRFPHWFQRLPALLARLDRAPVRATVEGSPVVVDAAVAGSAIHEISTGAHGSAQLPYVLSQAEAGRFGSLVSAIRALARADTGIDDRMLMPPAITCTEPWAVRDPTRIIAAARGTYLFAAEARGAPAVAEICAAWPKPDSAAEDWTRVRDDTPVLALVGGADPKDPPSNIAGIKTALPRAEIVVVPHQGHGVSGVGCVPRVIDAFLERGGSDGLDTSCVSLTPVPAFRLR